MMYNLNRGLTQRIVCRQSTPYIVLVNDKGSLRGRIKLRIAHEEVAAARLMDELNSDQEPVVGLLALVAVILDVFEACRLDLIV